MNRPVMSLLVVAAVLLTVLLVGCSDDTASTPMATPTPEPTSAPTATPALTPAPTAAPTPTPVLQLNVFEFGQTIPDFPSGIPDVVRGGASFQISGGGNVVITMGNGGTVEYSHATYTCVSGEGCRIENGRVTTGTIQVSEPSAAEDPTPIPTAIPTPTATPTSTATPTPTATQARPGKFSEFNGAGAATWRRMHEGGQVIACYEGLALPRDSFCPSEGFRFTSDYSEILDAKFLVAHLPDGDALVLVGNTTHRAGGDIRLGWITFENRVITHLDFNASQASTPTATATPTATPTPAQSGRDRAALVALYHNTDGPNWDDNTNWLTGRPIGEWHGVTTDSNGRVIRLELGRNNLMGRIPPELGDLSNLKWLRLLDNQLTGEIPPELGGLSNLRWLRLSNNELTGEIPPQLGGLSNLTWLDLSSNELTGEIPPWLGGLSNLTKLSLDNNQLTGEIPPGLGGLSNLTDLWLHSNQLAGRVPPELGGLPNLTVLWLGFNQLTGEIPSELGYPSNLRYLWLGSNQLTGEIPPELGGLSNLEHLHLSNNQLTGEIPPELGALSNLTTLHLSNNRLTGEIPLDLGRLSNLTWLLLGRNQLTGCIPEGLQDVAETDVKDLRLPVCGAATPTPTPMPVADGADGVCRVGLIVGPGESCTYPGTSTEFSVDSSGTGRFLFFTAGTGIDARNTTINGVTYNFKASKQDDGTWIIEAAGDS